MWGSGKATREFIYIDDLCKLIIKAMENYNSTEPLNVGTDTETSIKELAETVASLMGYKDKIIWDTTKPEGYMRKCLDSSKMKAYLGDSRFTSLYDGLTKTVKWAYENNIIKRC